MIQKKSGLQVTKPADLPKFPNLGIGGIAGAGKTHLLGTGGKGIKTLVIDTEGGTVTYSGKSFKGDKFASDGIDIISFEDIDWSAPDALTRFVGKIEGVFDYLIRTKNSDGYKIVALDSLTEFQERFLSLHKAADKRQSYGALRDTLYGIVHKARQTPAITVFTGRLKTAMDDVANREVVRFEVSPGVYSVISGLFDSLGFLDVKKKTPAPNSPLVRTLDFTYNTRTQGKDRYGFGDMENPSMHQILQTVSGN
jgi:hypothetical protein